MTQLASGEANLVRKGAIQTAGLLAVIMLLTLMQFYRSQSRRLDRDSGQPPEPPTNFELLIEGEVIGFSWDAPTASDLSHFVLLRREDGFFASGPGEGELILTAGWEERAAADRVWLETVPRQLYYSLFAVDQDGLYSEPVTASLFCDLSGCIRVPDLEALIHIHHPADAEALRDLIRRQIWPGGRQPQRLPDAVIAVADDRFPDAAEILSLRIDMKYGLVSTAYYFIPASPGGVLAIYHQGHEHNFDQNPALINRLLAHGYPVLAFSMPLVGVNALPDNPISNHNELAGLPRPLHYFVEPLAVALNHAAAGQAFEKIVMVGLSGGGWTTTLYAAIDPRISLSVSVAGGYPIYIRDQIPGNDGDFEQRSPDFYRRVSYLDLFILASSGRRYLQINNYFDPCCSQNAYASSYESIVASRAEMLGGQFQVRIDDTMKEHSVSEAAVEMILMEIAALER